MTKRRRIWLWAGSVVSLPLAAYAGISAVFYAWLNAAEPERWPAEKAAIWVYGALVLTMMFIVLFIHCLVSLIKEANRKYAEEQASQLTSQKIKL